MALIIALIASGLIGYGSSSWCVGIGAFLMGVALSKDGHDHVAAQLQSIKMALHIKVKD